MAWKKDLEKLKSALKAEDPEPRKAGPPPKAKPTEFKPFEEEDAVFLSAMGHRPPPRKPSAPAAPAQPVPAPSTSPQPAAAPSSAPQPGATPPVAPTVATPAAAAPPRPSETPSEFASAMGDLKGLVAIRPNLPGTPVPPKATPPRPAPPRAATRPVPPLPEPPRPEAMPEPVLPEPSAPPVPVQMQLAAGMAIDVDGSLDLKGHDRNDAEERLKERILDGHALGWRSLHVVLGSSEDLRAMLMDLLQGGCAGRIARYAQAPIPMGGGQAWILYFRHGTPPQEPA